jgi:hypothetical protein
MSSQGASAGSRSVPTGSTGCYGPTGTSQVPVGYRFSNTSLRDGSDWTALKKKLLVLNENKTIGFQDPWFPHGNNYRLDYLDGLFQSGGSTGCTGCDGAAYSGNGAF